MWDFVNEKTKILKTDSIVYDVETIDETTLLYICQGKLHIWNIDQNSIIDGSTNINQT